MLYEEWDWDTALEVAREEAFDDGREEERKYLLNLLAEGLSTEEIKQRLTQTKTN